MVASVVIATSSMSRRPTCQRQATPGARRIVAEYFGCVGTASWVTDDLTPFPPLVIGFTPESGRLRLAIDVYN